VEELLIKLGLNIYQVAGIIGVLVFFIAILIFLLLGFYARRVKTQQTEIDGARKQAKEVQEKFEKQLKDALDDCENKCAEKDKAIQVYINNERWYRNELHNSQSLVEELRREIQETGRRPGRRRSDKA
jgi:polyhydroxyalkanoate synthesis regulator phasin